MAETSTETFFNENEYWWAEFRWLWVCHFLDKIGYKTNESNEPLMLDVGCGAGFYAERLHNYGKVFCYDSSPEAVKIVETKGLPVIHGTAESLDFEDASLDFVLCLDVLEHIEDDRQVLGEIARVLKPGGHLAVAVPALDLLWTSRDSKFGHYRRYNKRQLMGRLSECGFKSLICSYFFTYLLPALLFLKGMERLKKESAKLTYNMPFPLNILTKGVSKLELITAKAGASVPFGSSLICLARKEGGN